MWKELLDQVREDLHDSPEEAKTYFDVSYARYLATLEFIGSIPLGRVLDLGCSPGHIAYAMVLAGFDLIGIDYHPGYSERFVPPRWRDRLEIRYIDIEKNDLPYPDASFDCVTCCEVMEHIAIRHPKEIVNDVYRVLKPGGVFLMTTPNVANIGNGLALWSGKNVFWEEHLFYGSLERHNREFTLDEMRTLMERSAFGTAEYRTTICNSNWNTRTCELVLHLLGKLRDKEYPVPEPFVHGVQYGLKLVDLYCEKENLKEPDLSLPFFNNTIMVRAEKASR